MAVKKSAAKKPTAKKSTAKKKAVPKKSAKATAVASKEGTAPAKKTKSAKSVELKTRPTMSSVQEFLATVDPNRRTDCQVLLDLFTKITQRPPVMWGSSIIGFDQYHYKYHSGREADWLATGFSPRKQNLTIYILPGFDRYPEIMAKLGNYTTSKSCLYVKSLVDIDLKVLAELIQRSVRDIKKLFPG